MLVFNEGVPRAGKSYDAVKNHILPALKKGRRVFARLNGLRHDLIAKHLGMSEADVRYLLVHVETKDVVSTFKCVPDETGKWTIPDDFKDALIVVDEVHEFYVKSRAPLPDPVENFWALLGQNGGDAVIMTQWINRVHDAVKARIERKTVFQKLTAVGMKNRYRATLYHSVGPMKFEKVGGKTFKYEPEIFPLYDGYAPGAENTEVYEEGGSNVWKLLAAKGVVMGAVGLVGAYFFLSYFFNGVTAKEKEPEPAKVETVQSFDLEGNHVGTETVSGAPAVEPVPAQTQPVEVDPYEGLTPDQRFVAELSDKGRARLASRADVGHRIRGWVEWVDDSGVTLESLEVSALEELGYTATWASFGVRLVAGKKTIIATPWPREVRVRESEPRLYRLDGGGGAGVASAASEAGTAAPGGVVEYTPGTRGDVFPRSPGYTTDTWTGEVKGL